jgi:hypothetical protein
MLALTQLSRGLFRNDAMPNPLRPERSSPGLEIRLLAS